MRLLHVVPAIMALMATAPSVVSALVAVLEVEMSCAGLRLDRTCLPHVDLVAAFLKEAECQLSNLVR